MYSMEGYPSGSRGLPTKQLVPSLVAWVRIPLPPPRALSKWPP